ncbi:10965_t:CDS:2 [Racocetra fulgida]|uniref:10965_t:CDS:1 n=1 Tax=Racocetra fulgida TaxID=60492 RepID=A0A9N8W3I9_9GLOM|nr:10965_t:CDS:2 [Racocetra fulgida]
MTQETNLHTPDNTFKISVKDNEDHEINLQSLIAMVDYKKIL